MPYIYRRVSNFVGPFAVHNTTPNEAHLRCTKLDLYRCMVTVGNPSFLSWQDIRKYGMGRVLHESIIDKVALVASNIESDRDGMRRHPIFDSFSKDKRRFISYNLGMAFGKLYSEKLFEIPNLIHLETLKKHGAVTLAPQPGNKTPEEPDLIGQTANGDWHVVEAKGVSTRESDLQARINKAKQQVSQVVAIHGKPPALGTACATYIGRGRIFTRVEDPPSDGGKRIEVDMWKFYRAYYAPFVLVSEAMSLERHSTRLDGLDIEFYELKDASRRLRIGLATEVLERLGSPRFTEPLHVSALLRQLSLSDKYGSDYSIGLDGFVVGYSER
jgi:hypothetical protein